MHKVGIIGLGFVGTAVETGLQSVAEIRSYDKFKDTENLDSVVNNSDIIFVCVPTPMEDSGHCDTSIVEEVCYDISRVAKERKAIVIKSTVPPGTTQMIYDYLGGSHSIMFNPEFLTERNFIQDFMEQDRIFIGSARGCESRDVALVLSLYEAFAKTQEKPAFIGELASAEASELLKYATNSFLATKVMFFNEIYDICKALEVDFEEVRQTMLMDSRIGKTHTNVPGFDGQRGFGGKCFPKDISALIALARDYDIEPMLIDTAWSSNLIIREDYDWQDIKGATTDCSYDDE
jgi:UDPglucose 6-dehydrogenase